MKLAFFYKFDYALGFIGRRVQLIINIELEKPVKSRKSHYDIRRNIAMSVIDLINILVELYGDITLDNTRIGLGFEYFRNLSNPQKVDLLRRLSGEEGCFKRADALAKFKRSINMWIITP